MTHKSLIYLSFALITLQSCLPYAKIDNYDNLTNVNKVREQKNLDKAIQTDYIFFFNKMINQRLSKLIGNNWEIYLKDSVNVYYGYGILTKKGIYVDTIYSINKSLLDKEFAMYDSMMFWDIKRKLLDYAYKDYDFGNSYNMTYAKDSIVMTSQGIVVNTQRKFKSQSQNQLKWRKGEIHYEILVDRFTLEMISKRMIK